MNATYRILCVTAYMCAFYVTVKGEGSKELWGGSTTAHAGLNLTGPAFADGSVPESHYIFGNPEAYQLRVRIRNASERLYLGFNVVAASGEADPDGDRTFGAATWANVADYANDDANRNDTWVRVRRASDNVIVLAFTRLQTGSAGWVNTRAQALAGPAAVVGAAGYTALVCTPGLAGDYIIEFGRGTTTVTVNGGANNDVVTYGNAASITLALSATRRLARAFDITVHDPTIAAGAAGIRSGRLFTQSWSLNTFGSGAAAFFFQGQIFAYTPDSVVNRFQFTSFDPFGFIISCNSFGVRSDLTVEENRQSALHSVLIADGVTPGAPEYKLFLNDPDINEFPTGIVGDLQGIDVQPCSQSNYCVNVAVSKPGNITLRIEFPNGSVRDYLVPVVAGINCIEWDGRDGNGVLVADNTLLDITVGYLTGLTHLPLRDVESSGGTTVTLVRPTTTPPPSSSPLPPPLMYWDDSNIATGTALDGLTQVVGTSGPAHRYTGRGNNATQEWINTWWYTNQAQEDLLFTIDSTAWFVTGVLNVPSTCEVSNQLTMYARFRNTEININNVSFNFATNYPAFITPIDTDTVVVADTTFINLTYSVNPAIASQVPPINLTWSVQASSATFPNCNSQNSQSCLLVILPVDFLDFTGQVLGTDARLQWQVGQENNVSHYWLERSPHEGGQFQTVGTISAIGSPSYEFTDPSLAPGTYLYRLRSVDYNGAQGLASNLVELRVEPNTPQMVYRAESRLLEVYGQTQTVVASVLEVTDMRGAIVSHITNTNSINLTDLASGIYVARYHDGAGQTVTLKFWVQ